MRQANKPRDSQQNPSTNLIVYRGPVRVPYSGVPNDEMVVTLGRFFALSGSTSLGLQASFNSLATSTTEWAGYAALYDEFRVLAFESKWCPHYGWGNTSVNHGSGLWITSHQSTTIAPFTSLNQMLEYSDWTEFHTGKNSTISWKMAATEEAQFQGTASPVSVGQIVGFIPIATTSSIPYGNIYASWRIQFRGRS